MKNNTIAITDREYRFMKGKQTNLSSYGRHLANYTKPIDEYGFYLPAVSGSASNYKMIWSTLDVDDDETEYTEAETVAEITELLSGSETEVNIELTKNLALEAGNSLIIPQGKNVTIKLDSTINCTKEAFVVNNGGTLTLKGEGTIATETKNPNAAISVNGANAFLTIDGVTIDVIGDNNVADNYAYGIYLKNNASMTFESGVVRSAGGSCIGTNNTTGGTTTITINGGELYSDYGYAIYNAAHGTININGGKVQGINLRMGDINIGGYAQIIPTNYTADTYEDIGDNFSTSGSIGLGDTIAVVAGTYTDQQGNDVNIHIDGNSIVKSDFRSAIGIYAVDTKVAQNVSVVVTDNAQIYTTDSDFEKYMIYDHDYISAAAEKYSKTYTPKADSDISVRIK